MSFGAQVYAPLLGIYPGVHLLDLKVCVHLPLIATTKQFIKAVGQIYTPNSNV